MPPKKFFLVFFLYKFFSHDIITKDSYKVRENVNFIAKQID